MSLPLPRLLHQPRYPCGASYCARLKRCPRFPGEPPEDIVQSFECPRPPEGRGGSPPVALMAFGCGDYQHVGLSRSPVPKHFGRRERASTCHRMAGK